MDGDNESLENVVDNDEGEEMHLRKIAEQNRDASADGEEEDAATGQETGSSSASRELIDDFEPTDSNVESHLNI